MKHETIVKENVLTVRERKTSFSLWKFVSTCGTKTFDKFNKEQCTIPNTDHADRIINYRLTLQKDNPHY